MGSPAPPLPGPSSRPRRSSFASHSRSRSMSLTSPTTFSPPSPPDQLPTLPRKFAFVSYSLRPTRPIYPPPARSSSFNSAMTNVRFYSSPSSSTPAIVAAAAAADAALASPLGISCDHATLCSDSSSYDDVGRDDDDDRRYSFGLPRFRKRSSHFPPAVPPPPSLAPGLLAPDSPSYIAARSANSLISFSRPTRIQAITLHYLNRLLDELLLLILLSARSLATDRIKTDGILRVLGGNGPGALLAKNAVLEAELELRNYLDGQRKEGGKVPLGLSATSKLDGTDGFPVKSAYEALRVRCQYYSTFGDLEDPSPHSPQDQHIMSTDGRPIASITPGVAIYVTALLEFVAEYILQNVGRVIERDNSDEASIIDLRKALEEDEGTGLWWSHLETRRELLRKEKEDAAATDKGRVKAWVVPDDGELDEAAGRKKFSRRSVNLSGGPPGSGGVTGSFPTTPRPGTANGHGREDSIATRSLSGHGGGPGSEGHRDGGSVAHSSSLSGTTVVGNGPGSIQSSTVGGHTSNASVDTAAGRRQSSEKGWSGLLGKRRGSFRSSQDFGSIKGAPAAMLSPNDALAKKAGSEDVFDGEDDFDALMMSGQTMKVSLTPNRLRTIEVAKKEAEAKAAARRRPGTLNTTSAVLREGEMASNRSPLPSPAPTSASRASNQVNGGAGSSGVDELADLPPRSLSRASSIAGVPGSARQASRPAGAKSATSPPSAYRGPDANKSSLLDSPQIGSGGGSNSAMYDVQEASPASNGSSVVVGAPPIVTRKGSVRNKLVARDEADRNQSSAAMRDMMDMFNATPPSPANAKGQFDYPTVVSGRESRSSQASFSSSVTGNERKLGSVGRMRNLFGRGNKDKHNSSSGGGGGNSAMQRLGSSASNASGFGGGGGAASIYSEDGGASSVHMATGPSGASLRGSSTNHSQAATPLRGNDPSSAISIDDEDEAVDPHMHSPPTPVAKESSLQGHQQQQQQYSRPASRAESHRGAALVAGGVAVAGAVAAHEASGSGGGIVGLYEEPRRAASPESAPRSPQGAEPTAPGRKVPWGYARQGSAGSQMMMRRASSSGLRNSGSHDGHAGGAMAASASAGEHAPSAWTGAGLGEESRGAKTPTPLQLNGVAGGSSSRRGSFSMARPASAGYVRSDTARVLATLERQMRDCETAAECRSLVMSALAAAASAMHVADRALTSPSAEQLGFPRDSPPGGAATSADGGAGVAAPLPTRAVAAAPIAPVRPPAGLSLVMADGYDAELDPTSTAYQHNALVAGWLLGEDSEQGYSSVVTSAQPVSSSSNGATTTRPASVLDSPKSHRGGGEDSSRNHSLEDEHYASADERVPGDPSSSPMMPGGIPAFPGAGGGVGARGMSTTGLKTGKISRKAVPQQQQQQGPIAPSRLSMNASVRSFQDAIEGDDVE